MKIERVIAEELECRHTVLRNLPTTHLECVIREGYTRCIQYSYLLELVCEHLASCTFASGCLAFDRVYNGVLKRALVPSGLVRLERVRRHNLR